jgi:hypothetical protein
MAGGVGARDPDLEAAVAETLRDYLDFEGFSEPVAARTGGLIAHRGTVMLRFLRTARASHPFEVQVSIGQRRTDDIVEWVRIPRLTPEGSVAHACWSWELPDLPSLTAALDRLREEVLVPHVAAFWRDPRRLEPVFAAQDREVERRFRAGIEQQNLRAARESFQHGRFREAEQYFRRLEQLSDVDRRRQDIARGAAERDDTEHDTEHDAEHDAGAAEPDE